MYSKHDPKYQTLPPNTKFNRNGLDLLPDPVRGGSGLRSKDVPSCVVKDDAGNSSRDVSSPSSTPTIDSAPEDGGSLRIVSSESGFGSSISSGCSFQSNSINLMTRKEDLADGREGELKARGLPITISLNSSNASNGVQPFLPCGNSPIERKGLSDHSSIQCHHPHHPPPPFLSIKPPSATAHLPVITQPVVTMIGRSLAADRLWLTRTWKDNCLHRTVT